MTQTQTQAETHLAESGFYESGETWCWLDDNGDAPEHVSLTRDQDHGVRYEWPDGSALVISGDGWDMGIHRERLADAQALLDAARDPDGDEWHEPHGCRVPAEYSWTTSHAVLPGPEHEWAAPKAVAQ